MHIALTFKKKTLAADFFILFHKKPMELLKTIQKLSAKHSLQGLFSYMLMNIKISTSWKSYQPGYKWPKADTAHCPLCSGSIVFGLFSTYGAVVPGIPLSCWFRACLKRILRKKGEWPKTIKQFCFKSYFADCIYSAHSITNTSCMFKTNTFQLGIT